MEKLVLCLVMIVNVFFLLRSFSILIGPTPSFLKAEDPIVEAEDKTDKIDGDQKTNKISSNLSTKTVKKNLKSKTIEFIFSCFF